MEKNNPIIYLKEEFNKKSLLEYKVIRSNECHNKKRRVSEIEEDEQISIVSDAMFKTMLNNEKRIKFPCKLLSCILDSPYEELLKNLTLTKNEFDKDSVVNKGERGDFLAKIGENYVSIEMNMKNYLERNIEYLDRINRSEVKVGGEYIYPALIQINLNNFCFEGHDKVMEIYKLQNEKGEMLSFKIFVQIYLPLLLEKRYNLGIESLSELEKCILVMIETDRKKASELAVGDSILEEYMEEAKMVEKNDNFLREAYDHRQAEIEAAEEIAFGEGYGKGINEGIEQGINKGIEQNKKDIIQKMLNKGMTKEEVSNILDISMNQINRILESE